MPGDSTPLNLPRLRVLSEEQKETIYEGVLELLERTGVVVEHEEARELLSGAGARVGSRARVYLPPTLIKSALSDAPRSIIIYNRLGEQAVVLDEHHLTFCSQVDSTYFFDPFDGRRRQCVRADAQLGALLCDALPNIHMVSFSALYKDAPGTIAIRLGHKDTVMNCSKPLMHGTADLANLEAVVEMAALIVGGKERLAERPYYVHYAEPLSPLTHTEQGVAKLLYCVEHGIPVIYTPMTVAGASAPVTAAGNLVMCMAESLSGMVIAQLKRPGAPVIFGGVPTVMDMASTIVSYGAPELYLWSAALTEMGHHLRLPVFSTAGCTDAISFDQQAAAESALSCLMAALSGANLIHDVGFTEASHSASLELIAATDEFIGLIEHLLKGVEITPETLALEVINAVGPGGNFLDTEHTLRHFRNNWFPGLMNRLRYDRWQAAGGIPFPRRVNKQVRKIIETHRPPPLPQLVVNELNQMEKGWWSHT